MVGGNDLFVSKCTDRFVLANILNVLKRIYESQPEAQFIVHGIMPRKDNPDSKSNALGHLWNRAQDINLLVKKFTKHSGRVHFVNAGPKFTSESGFKGRRFLDASLISDGIHPTSKGMQVWGDVVEKKILETIHGFDKSKLKQKDKKKKDQGDG
jgi:lysophospholipase L1-like esterase